MPCGSFRRLKSFASKVAPDSAPVRESVKASRAPYRRRARSIRAKTVRSDGSLLRMGRGLPTQSPTREDWPVPVLLRVLAYGSIFQRATCGIPQSRAKCDANPSGEESLRHTERSRESTETVPQSISFLPVLLRCAARAPGSWQTVPASGILL